MCYFIVKYVFKIIGFWISKIPFVMYCNTSDPLSILYKGWGIVIIAFLSHFSLLRGASSPPAFHEPSNDGYFF